MDAFSSKAEDSLCKQITDSTEEFSVTCEEDLVREFELDKCSKYIRDNGLTKICLQFPDSLLQYSVKIALYLEKNSNQKIFVLGDTTYGSCCVDEVAAEHIDGDCVIHFGHACLSRNARLPTLHVLPRASLDIAAFVSTFAKLVNEIEGSVLLLYDVAFSHLTSDLKEGLVEWKDRVIFSKLSLADIEKQPCGVTCQLHEGCSEHSTTMLGRKFCSQQTSPTSVVYITHKHTQNLLNFALTFRDSKFYTYSSGASDCKAVDFSRNLRKRLFLVEKIKDSRTLGIIVGTLSVEKFVGAIDQIKKLAKFRGKRCYIFSVGKPNPAKLANFPEVEVYVMVSCPEACIENEKEYMQPVVTLLEAELALNPSRQWDDSLSVDFRDMLEGGPHFKSLPEGQEPLEVDVSLLSNKIRCSETVDNSETSTELSIRDSYQISVASSYSSGRSWRGLEQALGETPVSQVTKGRSGIPLAYDEEKPNLPT